MALLTEEAGIGQTRVRGPRSRGLPVLLGGLDFSSQQARAQTLPSGNAQSTQDGK